MFRIAIIGPGSICRTYMEALKTSETVEVAAIAGRDTEKGRALAAEYRVPYYTSLLESEKGILTFVSENGEDMYEKEKPDAVLICTPTFTHEEMVRSAIAHGVHVMCEKPFVLNTELAEQLFAEAKNAGVRMMVMHVVRFWPEYTKVKNMIDAGELGEIKNVYLNRLSSHPTWATWHRDPEKSGGGLYDLHIHDVDYLCSVFGKVESVYAVGKQEESGCYNNISTVMRFGNGVSAVVEGMMDITGDFGFTTNMRVNGANAAVEMLNKGVYLADGTSAKANHFVLYKKGEPEQQIFADKYNPYARETEYFAECVKTGSENLTVPNSDVVYVLRVLAAIQRSLESGAIVRVE